MLLHWSSHRWRAQFHTAISLSRCSAIVIAVNVAVALLYSTFIVPAFVYLRAGLRSSFF
jgi:hypothetical protein